jgi:SAM-dependent methyltransferase
MAGTSGEDHQRYPVVYAATIACSSMLLFLVQPIMAKALLPRFGGSAGVWVTCMLFFQVVLLLGYGYSYGITRHLSHRAQGWIHAALLLLSLAALPLRLRTQLSSGGEPAIAILALLAVSVGLPYFLLSTTGPLLQSWYAASGMGQFPYRLFALSNAASLAALLAYPVAIEPVLPMPQQLRWWSGAYLVMVALACVAAGRAMQKGAGRALEKGATPAPEIEAARTLPWVWIALAACASVLWMAVANHLSQEVAAVPFLWVLPLSLYLLSFILCFGQRRWYQPVVFGWLLPAAWVAMGWRIAIPGSLQGDLAVFSVALFVCCMFCHGELAQRKPEPAQGLAFFYLMLALGGALGAVFVGVVAPRAFNYYLELPVGITACILLRLALGYGFTPKRLMRLGVIAAVAFVLAARYRSAQGEVLHVRNFYGALMVSDSGTGEGAARRLYNGRTLHGVEFLSAARSRLATAYYGPESGAGLVLSRPSAGRRVGLVGLGVGTLAAYGRRGDEFRFYEINPAVIQVASQNFRFLRESEAKTDVVAGDGRLALELEAPKSFDVIVLDAFSDDSIPVHLLTREAFEIYFRLLKDGGVLAIHLTNRYLNLDPVVLALAENMRKKMAMVHSAADPERQILAADWAVVADTREQLGSLLGPAGVMETGPKTRPWTDEYSNLFRVWR